MRYAWSDRTLYVKLLYKGKLERGRKLANLRIIYRCWFYATLVAGMLLSNPARAAVISYNEASNGDFPQSPEGSPVFDLDIGTNTFTGEISFLSFGPSDLDSFAFNIPASTRLESILLNISLLSVGSGIFSTTGYDLQNSSFNLIASESIPIPSANLNLFASNLPLGSGQFALQNSFVAGLLSPGEFRTAPYTFSLNVVAATPVPEPSFMLGTLTFSLLAGSLLLKRKQKTES
ncbi:hypothetical protein [Nostoc sphaeroides]|uniref:RTX N-terminal domain n=1 Tax=Nostoc sphaeroides CCNUC1 TaxID=2653204 RepID=A0A5P8WEV1_9NOSO|nr:hypothetical protein [Nostoc sphaeroides]QFS51345.1 RTX N-terminal domain [Nostoc sphaeroides CCNUC1]QFS51573.1 type I secretion target GGXGXDXXX repeat protein domain protein [Nostoc sphaeroides CCNUC1]